MSPDMALNVGLSRRRDLSGAGGRRAVYVASHRRSVPVVRRLALAVFITAAMP
jgi:hypothetical protein